MVGIALSGETTCRRHNSIALIFAAPPNLLINKDRRLIGSLACPHPNYAHPLTDMFPSTCSFPHVRVGTPWRTVAHGILVPNKVRHGA